MWFFGAGVFAGGDQGVVVVVEVSSLIQPWLLFPVPAFSPFPIFVFFMEIMIKSVYK